MKVLANNRFPSGSSQFAYVHKYEPYAKAPLRRFGKGEAAPEGMEGTEFLRNSGRS